LAGLRASPKLAALAVTVAAAALVAAAVARYPAGGGLPFQPGLLLAFDASKVPAFLRGLAVLVALNRAAWCAGGLGLRLLGGPVGRRPLLDALRRMALGFLALADGVLLLAELPLPRHRLLARALD